MITVLITGANGFVANSLIPMLYKNHYSLRVTSRSNYKPKCIQDDDEIRFISFDFNSNASDFDELVDGIDIVIHLGGNAHSMSNTKQDDLEHRNVNYLGTKKLVEAAARKKVKRFIFLSTMKVYGDGISYYENEAQLFTEETMPAPLGSYAQSKLDAENIVSDFCDQSDMEYVIIRSPLVYGPQVKANFKTLLKVVKSGMPLPLGKINNYRSYIFVENLSDAIKNCMIKNEAANNVFLVSDMNVSVSELAKKISRYFNQKPTVFNFSIRALDLLSTLIGRKDQFCKLTNSMCIDSTKIQTRLGWEPKINMEEALSITTTWYLNRDIKENAQNLKLIIVVSEAWVFMSHRLPLAKAAIAAGYDVTVITRVGELKETLANEGINVINLDFVRSSRWPIKDLINLIKLVNILNRQKVDIIHNVSMKIILLGTIAGLLSKTKVIVNAFTGLGYVFSSQEFHARVIRLFLVPVLKILLKNNHCHAIFQNPDDMALFASLGIIEKERTVLIRGSGVDINQFSQSHDDNLVPVVMLASRMLWDKGIGEFVEAAKLAAEDNLNARFVLVGDVDPQNPMSIPKSKLNSWSGEGYVNWLGHSNEMPSVLKSSTVVCLPSYREGLPKVLLEAAAIGRPLVATDVPGCREIVIDGENGILVKLKDVDSLYEAIKKLVLDEEMRRSMGKNSRKLVEEKLSTDIINAQTIQLYKTASSEFSDNN
ncbi:MAG: NAD-dependent epimerase/dehydratase family protein [Proteobacteria bacterium]|nr:NAD-dependent epimerase/dehydratase family protein [Pseudomonadota bacterium]NOG59116.1 NAD-dependent epimerase/dehydratase family protein [Pseudomonadota bacterium]